MAALLKHRKINKNKNNNDEKIMTSEVMLKIHDVIKESCQDKLDVADNNNDDDDDDNTNRGNHG